MKIAWLTDSTTSFNEMKSEKIFSIPMTTILNNINYNDYEFENYNEFLSLLKSHGEGAKTTQPSLLDFENIYSNIERMGYTHVIAIHPSSELTGSFNTSNFVKNQFSMNTYVLDSRIGNYPQRKLLEYGFKLEQEGLDFDVIIEKLEMMKNKLKLYLIPNNIDQVKKSGRVSKGKGILASLLNIKILLGFDNGFIGIEKKGRTLNSIDKALINKIESAISYEGINEIGIMHTNNLEKIEKWENLIKEIDGEIKIIKEPLVPVAAVHTGIDTIAIGW